ncbi:MAG: FAD-dependent oxidoreductase [Oscillospiraceae bacterium]|nr:FAD-dependent oxidoreductase [Oscillospiraceae bacterium]
MRKIIAQVGKHITDCMDVKFGLVPMDESRPEYWMLNEILTDEMAALILKMKVRKPYTPEQLAPRMHWSLEKTTSLLEQMAKTGIVEYNWHNEDRHKQYFVPVFVVGSSENLVYNRELYAKMPEKVGEFSYQMSYLPLKMLSPMVPPGGGGLGFHVIPVENAIPHESESLDIEHLSFWLEKYKERDQFAIAPCQCRRAMATRGEGCGELEDNVCILVGDYAQYLWETDKDVKRASYDEIVALLKRCEENGYMHQITNGDGRDDIFGICNCTVGSCFGLRCSQLFNNPNMSASAFRARVTPENCVACGKCVEVCPTGAAKLGQKLCTSSGPVQYPKVTLPDETLHWGKENWDYDFREHSQIQVYETGTAPCKTACPAHIAIQGYVRMAAEGRYAEALELIKQDNPFPAVCGSICNKRCENACTRGKIDAPISIDAIKKFIAEQDLHAETRYIPKKVRHKGDTEDFTQKIAIIGAGPSGLSCAYYLAQMSYPVTVFDRDPIPGGMLTKGIPSFRLEKDIVHAEIDILKEMGVEFRCGVEVGKDVTIPQLREQGYKAFYLAIGLQRAQKLSIPGEDLDGVFGGIDFLKSVNRGDTTSVKGDVVVIGGGNAAIDVSRTLTRLGDSPVRLFCLESDAEMPTVPDEKDEAIAEGVLINNCWGPKRILGEDGRVTGVEFMRCLRVKDETGRFAPEYDESETIVVPCSSVYVSIGQCADFGTVLDGTRVETFNGRFVKTAEITWQTADPDIFGGGDIATGPKFTIDAIANGREGATSIHRFVQPGQSLTIARNLRQFKELDKNSAMVPLAKAHAPQRQANPNNEEKTRTMHDNRVGLTEEQVKLEASRCLSCGATVVDEKKCIGCGICTTRCKFDAIHLNRTHPEFANYINGDYSKQALIKHGIKRAVTLTIKQAGETITRQVGI